MKDREFNFVWRMILNLRVFNHIDAVIREQLKLIEWPSND